jgi:DNA-binding transcriptional LysR family regulator
MIKSEWSDFRIVLALSRGGSVAGAARELGVDSSTISRRLAALEEAVGASLVLRGGREFTWTPEGRAALAAAEAMEVLVSSATSTIRAAKQEIEGVVKVSCVPSLVPALMPMLSAANEKHPKLTIELNSEFRMLDLAKGEADIAIRMSRPTELDVVARRTFEMGHGVYASKAYVTKHGLPASPGELANHSLVLYIEAMHRQPCFHWIEDYRKSTAQMTRVDSTDMATRVIASGSGIGVIPCFIADERPEMVRIFPEPVVYSIGWIVYHETARNTARVRAVVDALAEFLESRADMFSGRAAK